MWKASRISPRSSFQTATAPTARMRRIRGRGPGDAARRAGRRSAAWVVTPRTSSSRVTSSRPRARAARQISGEGVGRLLARAARGPSRRRRGAAGSRPASSARAARRAMAAAARLGGVEDAAGPRGHPVARAPRAQGGRRPAEAVGRAEDARHRARRRRPPRPPARPGGAGPRRGRRRGRSGCRGRSRGWRAGGRRRRCGARARGGARPGGRGRRRSRGRPRSASASSTAGVVGPGPSSKVRAARGRSRGPRAMARPKAGLPGTEGGAVPATAAPATAASAAAGRRRARAAAAAADADAHPRGAMHGLALSHRRRHGEGCPAQVARTAPMLSMAVAAAGAADAARVGTLGMESARPAAERRYTPARRTTPASVARWMRADLRVSLQRVRAPVRGVPAHVRRPAHRVRGVRRPR